MARTRKKATGPKRTSKVEKARPPTSARELLARYAAGERHFGGMKLDGASLREANLRRSNFSRASLGDAYFREADLRQANFSHADLHGASFREADLRHANLRHASLQGAHFFEAGLSGADLSKVDLFGAHLTGTDLTGARLVDARFMLVNIDGADFTGASLSGATLTGAIFIGIDLTPFCEADPPVMHHGPSTVDFRSIVKSLRSPNLKNFLHRTGMPEVFIEYMVECARAMDGSLIKKLLQSTFISYGGPDEPLARRLYEALHRNGVTTFFFPEHAKPGQKIGRVVRENVQSYDRILLLCSKASLNRPGLLYEIEETLERERRDGGAEYLIPIELDDCLRVDGAVLRKDLVRVLRDRVCADFRGAQEDEEVFGAGLRKLIAALRPPDLAPWRPPGSTKPTEP